MGTPLMSGSSFIVEQTGLLIEVGGESADPSVEIEASSYALSEHGYIMARAYFGDPYSVGYMEYQGYIGKGPRYGGGEYFSFSEPITPANIPAIYLAVRTSPILQPRAMTRVFLRIRSFECESSFSPRTHRGDNEPIASYIVESMPDYNAMLVARCIRLDKAWRIELLGADTTIDSPPDLGHHTSKHFALYPAS